MTQRSPLLLHKKLGDSVETRLKPTTSYPTATMTTRKLVKAGGATPSGKTHIPPNWPPLKNTEEKKRRVWNFRLQQAMLSDKSAVN